eukprot:XP_016658639.1 PREDICTED: uncharacterized protein LOC107883345 [Acyrthosiphon pisum]
MAGSIADNIALYKKKSFVYVPPTTPSDLFESTSITIDFTARKFIHIGLDPTSEKCEVIIRILTPSRYVHITYNTLKSLFTLMGNILSFILSTPVTYKRTVFHETETEKISSMVYGGENVLVIESKNREGCRVLLSRLELIRLQYLEGTIFEIIHRTGSYTHSLFAKQVRAYIMYLEEKFGKMQSPPVTEEEIIMFINKNTDYQIVQSEPILTSQIQLLAAAHVAGILIERKARNAPSLFDGEHAMDSPWSPSYSPLPTQHTFNHAEDNFLYKPIDHIDGPMPLDSQQQSFDENDGPDFFNSNHTQSQFTTPEPSDRATYTLHPTPLRKVKRRLF